jgi:ABC-type cobalamin/Fe3+-siderophores transport system ATPase subunit
MLIGLQNVTFEFGARAIISEATWHIQPGERIGLIGYNGTGKSTILKLLVGQYTPSKGTVEKGRDTTIGYLHQDLLSFDTNETITEVALGAFERVRALEKEIEQLGIDLEANPEDNDILIKYTDALHELDVLDGLDSLKLCTGYKLNGKHVDIFPVGAEDAAACEPIYEEMPGWKDATVGAKSLDALPAAARAYVKSIEELVEMAQRPFTKAQDLHELSQQQCDLFEFETDCFCKAS